MVGEIARRVLAKAAELNAEVKAAAAGDGASREAAIQTLRRKQGAAQITYAYALPQDKRWRIDFSIIASGAI